MRNMEGSVRPCMASLPRTRPIIPDVIPSYLRYSGPQGCTLRSLLCFEGSPRLKLLRKGQINWLLLSTLFKELDDSAEDRAKTSSGETWTDTCRTICVTPSDANGPLAGPRADNCLGPPCLQSRDPARLITSTTPHEHGAFFGRSSAVSNPVRVG